VTDKARRLPQAEDQRGKMLIREGLRLILMGWELLNNLPRSFETKKEQGRR
jgi:hypothetical protein